MLPMMVIWGCLLAAGSLHTACRLQHTSNQGVTPRTCYILPVLLASCSDHHGSVATNYALNGVPLLSVQRQPLYVRGSYNTSPTISLFARFLFIQRVSVTFAEQEAQQAVA